MLDELLDSLEAKAKVATPGARHYLRGSSGDSTLKGRLIGASVRYPGFCINGLYREDAEYIAACSPDVILRLVEEVRRLRARLNPDDTLKDFYKLEAENERLSKEHYKCHEWNNQLVSEHYQLKDQLKTAREALEKMVSMRYGSTDPKKFKTIAREALAKLNTMQSLSIEVKADPSCLPDEARLVDSTTHKLKARIVNIARKNKDK